MTPGSAGRVRRLAAVVALVTSVSAFGAFSGAQADSGAQPPGCERRNNNTYRKLLECLTVEGVMEHLQAFQDIADANGGTRASGTPGYDASVDYVVSRLEAAGYEPEVQSFEFGFFELFSSSFSQTAPVQRDFAQFDITTGEGQYDVMTFSPSGMVTDTAVVPTNDVVVPIGDNPPSTSNSGCEPEDFPAETAGNVALVQRGTCDFYVKALNAQEAGAIAVIVFNEGQPGRESVVLGTLGEPAIEDITIPVIGISYALGVEFIETEARVSLSVDSFSEIREAQNVLAELEGKNDDNVVMLGAHLDSVPEGPGLNDNGSGSAAILEVAETMRRNKPENTLRFAWWGAEEFGLLGSNFYVGSLSEEELERIALYLNFDMVASPNFVRFIYDGDESTFEAPVDVPEGSDVIEEVFQRYFDLVELPYEDTEFNARSDYQAFILSDIPAGGLFTGAEGIKTPEQAAVYGGVAGLPYDPCYHAPCDEMHEPNAVPELEAAYGESVLIGNINTLVLGQNVDATGYAALTFAYSTEDVNGVPGKDVPGGPSPKVMAAR